MTDLATELPSDAPKMGTIACVHEGCRNHANYMSARSRGYFCGVHCRGNDRVPLERFTRAEIDLRNAAHLILVRAHAAQNARDSRAGAVALYKMRMMHAVPFDDNWLDVFPNFRAGDGFKPGSFCAKALSPKFIGPIEHGQPGLPLALSLENFHQGSKRMVGETDAEFIRHRKEMYEDPIPRRHKDEKYPGMSREMEYFEWITAGPGGEIDIHHHLTYVQSRQFYCTFYERALRDSNVPPGSHTKTGKAYRKLVKMRARGFNLRICGYDAFDMPQDAAGILTAYLDPTKPFGHERVIVAMLCLPPEELPWRSAAEGGQRTFDL